MLCPECGQEMMRVGRYWVCGEDGTTVPVARSESMVSGLPADHPDFALVESLPTPLAFSLVEFLTERHPYIALHRLCDTAEIITRFFTIVVLSDLLRQCHGEFPEPVRIALTEKIERPTFGAWKELLRIACEYLPKRKGRRHCFVKELPEYVRKHWLPALGSGRAPHEEALISLRNFIVHSARLSHDEAERLLGAHRERFLHLVHGLSFLADYPLVACTKEGNLFWLRGVPAEGVFPKYTEPIDFSPQSERVYLLKGAEGLDVFPLQAFTEVMQIREERVERFDEVSPQVYFRVSERGYLEYVPFSGRVAFSQLKGSVYERFQEVFRLEAWRAQRRREVVAKGQWAEVNERIAELMEVFVGRDEHVHQVKERIKRTEQGVLWISGKPGVGKSALMAKLARDYLDQPHFFTFAYFFRLGEGGCSTGEFLESVLKAVGTALGRTITPAPHLPDRPQQFVEAVRELVEGQGKKVLFLIDGLDEIGRKEQDFVHVPFMVQWPKVVWVCAGRPEPELERVLKERGAVWVFDEEGLPPLDETAIRAMLTEHLGRLKYALFRRDDEEGGNRFIRVVTRKSQGLPLYVRMVIDDLKAGRWTVDDEDRLPEGLTAYFEDILERLRVSDVGTVLTPIFCLLAWAKEPLTEGMLKVLLRTHHLSRSSGWDALFRKAVEYGHMMLQRRPNSDGVVGLSFYHDAFRQHLLESARVRENRAWAKERWLEVIAQWPEMKKEGPDIYRYAIRHYAEHLKEAGAWEELIELARDEAFAQTQREVLPAEPDLPLQTLQLALQAGIEANRPTWMAEMVLRHARWVETTETPLQALETYGLDRAIGLAKQRFERDYRIGTLWLLLLAWACHNKGRDKDAEQCLAEIISFWNGSPIMKFENSDAEIVGFLLGELGLIYGSRELVILFLNDHELCSVTKRWTQLRQWDAALTIVEDIKHDWMRSKIIGKIINEMANAGEFDKAMALTKSIVDELERFESIRYIIKAMANAKRWNEAIKMTETMEYDWARSEMYAEIVKSIAQAGRWEHAMKITEKIECYKYRVIALRTIAEVMALKGQIEKSRLIINKAIEVASQIKDPYWYALAIAALIKTMVRVGEIGKARSIFKELISLFNRIKETDRRDIMLISIAKSMAEAKQWEYALGVSKQIRDINERINSLLNIAGSMSSSGLIEKAFQVFKQAMSLTKRIAETDKRDKVLVSIAKSMAEVKQWEYALGVSKQIRDINERINSLLNIAGLMSSSGLIEKAFQVFKQAMSLTKRIAETDKRDKALVSITKSMVEVKQWEYALGVSEQIQDIDDRLNYQITIAETMAKEGYLEDARVIFNKIVTKEIEISLDPFHKLQVIAKAMYRAGLVDEALQVFNMMLLLNEKRFEHWYRIKSLKKIAITMAKVKQWEQALKMLEEIWDHLDLLDRDDTLEAFSEAMVQMNQWTKVLDIIKTHKNVEFRCEVLGYMCEVMVREGQWDAFWLALEVFLKSAKKYINFFNFKIRKIIHINRWDQMLKIVESFFELDERAEAFVSIAKMMVEEGEREEAFYVLDKALAMAENISSIDYRAEVFLIIAKTMAELGQAKAARHLFERAISEAEQIVNPKKKTFMLNDIAEAMFIAGYMIKAKQVFNRALAIAESLSDIESKIEGLLNIAETMANFGQTEAARHIFERVIAIAEQISFYEYKCWALRRISVSIAYTGQLDKALKIVKNIEDEINHVIALGTIAMLMSNKGRIGEGRHIFENIWHMSQKLSNFGLLWDIVLMATRAGFNELAVSWARRIRGIREKVCDVLDAFVDRNAKEPVFQLLPLCGWMMATALHACVCLIRLFPDDAKDLADIVTSFL